MPGAVLNIHREAAIDARHNANRTAGALIPRNAAVPRPFFTILARAAELSSIRESVSGLGV